MMREYTDQVLESCLANAVAAALLEIFPSS
jgi:hypothetical protein